MMQREWLWALSAAVVGVLLWLARRRRSRSAVSEPSWEARLEEQVQRLGERESDLEGQLARLRRQEDALEQQVRRLGEQEAELESQVTGIRDREEKMLLQIEQLRTREEALEGVVESQTAERDRLRDAVDELRKREHELEQQVERRSGQLEQVRTELNAAHAEWQTADAKLAAQTEDLDRAKQSAQFLEQRVRELETRSRSPRAAQSHWSKLLPPTTFADLIKRAGVAFPSIRIPESAPQRLHELDSAREREAWVRETWRALGALHEYATTEHEFSGNFLRWSRDSGNEPVWHVDRISLQESPTTMAMYGNSREFEIDPQVAPEGRITMQAHLKISSHGGGHIPRVFFHDDTAGDDSTGQIHIGFIGPHHLVPVASGS